MQACDLMRGQVFTDPADNVAVRNRDNYRWGQNEITITNIRRAGETPEDSTIYYKDSGGNKYKSGADWFVEKYGMFKKEGQNKEKKYIFTITCVNTPSDVVEYTIEDTINKACVEIDYDEFSKHINEQELEDFNQGLAIPLYEDWHVNFFSSELPSGKPVYIFQHSGIEHFFTQDGYLDCEKEDAIIQEKLEKYWEEQELLNNNGITAQMGTQPAFQDMTSIDPATIPSNCTMCNMPVRNEVVGSDGKVKNYDGRCPHCGFDLSSFNLGAPIEEQLSQEVIAKMKKKSQRERYPQDYDLELPEYSGKSHKGELVNMLSHYYSGQWDPVYAYISRGGIDMGIEELIAIEDELEKISSGKYLDSLGEDASDEEQDELYMEMETAKDWLPTIKKIYENLSDHRKWPEDYDESGKLLAKKKKAQARDFREEQDELIRSINAWEPKPSNFMELIQSAKNAQVWGDLKAVWDSLWNKKEDPGDGMEPYVDDVSLDPGDGGVLELAKKLGQFRDPLLNKEKGIGTERPNKEKIDNIRELEHELGYDSINFKHEFDTIDEETKQDLDIIAPNDLVNDYLEHLMDEHHYRGNKKAQLQELTPQSIQPQSPPPIPPSVTDEIGEISELKEYIRELEMDLGMEPVDLDNDIYRDNPEMLNEYITLLEDEVLGW